MSADSSLSLREQAEPWPRGLCEAGYVTFSKFQTRTHDDWRRGRWLVGGVILCGSCFKAALAEEKDAG